MAAGHDQRPRGERPETAEPPSSQPPVASRDLLGDDGQLLIEHKGALYRLRLTSRGKLILTK